MVLSKVESLNTQRTIILSSSYRLSVNYRMRSKSKDNLKRVDFLLPEFKCSVNECLNLLLVLHLASSCNGTCGFTTSIIRILALMMLCLTCSGIDTGPDIAPRTIIQRLFLTPQETGIRIFIKMRCEHIIGNGESCSMRLMAISLMPRSSRA